MKKLDAWWLRLLREGCPSSFDLRLLRPWPVTGVFTVPRAAGNEAVGVPGDAAAAELNGGALASPPPH
jgi:hypothetical protein